MSHPIAKTELARTNQLVLALPLTPNLRQDIESRHFDLPVALHKLVFGLFLAYLGVMFTGFSNPEMILPMAIFVIFTVGFYVVPALWCRVGPERADTAISLNAFFRNGVPTHIGWCSGRDAAVQVLLLPALIFGWGVAVTMIAAFV